MATLLLGVVVVLQILSLYLYTRARKGLHQDVRSLFTSIARDLNAVTRTIALYAGQEPIQGAPTGEIDPVEAARRKAEIWRTARAGRTR